MIQQIWADIGPVRPFETPEIRLYVDFPKLDRVVPDGFKERPFQVGSQIHDLLASIRENQLNPEVFQGSHALDAGIDLHSIATLLEGIDRAQGLMPLGKLPVRPKFIAMEIRPFEYKDLGSPRKISFDQFKRFNRERSGEFRVLGMEMGRSMIAGE